MASWTSLSDMEEMDNGSGQVNSDCLGVPVILREIFQFFSTTELFQLSIVNKQWNYEARSLMRNRGNLSATINKNHTCQDLRTFASDLRRMRDVTKVVPFSGITISVGGTKCSSKDYCQQSPNRELEPVYEEILRALKWKHFSLKHLAGWEDHKSCPGYILGHKIFRKLDSVLEELSVQLESNEANSFKDQFLQGCSFSRLKTFRLLNEEESIEPEWSDLIKTVVSNAPHLQVLYTKECVDLQANLLEGSSAVHEAGSSYSPSMHHIPESVARVIKMHEMDLLHFSRDFSLEEFNRIAALLLQSSRTVMTSIYIDVTFLAPLINYGVCMENVRNFELALVPRYLVKKQPHILRVAKTFDYTSLFPNLNTITILHTKPLRMPDEFIEMTEQVNAALGAPAPDRVANIKQLRLDMYRSHRVFRRGASFHILAQMFPHVQKLSIITDQVPVDDIRDFWADLKEVDILLAWNSDLLTNLDSVFCGIFPEEVAQLREEDEEYLRRVNIVPVRPCVSYWKELRTFEMHYEKRGDSYTGPTDDSTFVFSKVTCLIAFQRCPNLNVTVTSEDERLAEALFHLWPYATVRFHP